MTAIWIIKSIKIFRNETITFQNIDLDLYGIMYLSLNNGIPVI